MSWRDKYKVHPAADVFPMMSDLELAELGKDIKANGLKHPTDDTHLEADCQSWCALTRALADFLEARRTA